MIDIITTRDDLNSILSEFDMYDTYNTPYCGSISKGIIDDFNNTTFIKVLKNYFIENNIISVFLGLNAFIPIQNKILANLDEIFPIGKVVNINLKLDIILKRQKYHRKSKNHINKSRSGCKIIKVTNSDDVYSFIKIYYENIIRVNANKSYYFIKEYIYKFFECKDFETEIFLARDKETDNIISRDLFFKKKSIKQYHLAGTKNDFLHLKHTQLLIVEIRAAVTNRGYNIFNHGGGFGTNGDDLLFKFKSSFSDDFFPLFSLKVNSKS